MRLDIRIFTGDSTDKYLSKLKHGVNEPKISVDEKEFVGQMSKKICPVQLNNTNKFTRKSRVVKGYKTVVEYTLEVSV